MWSPGRADNPPMLTTRPSDIAILQSTGPVARIGNEVVRVLQQRPPEEDLGVDLEYRDDDVPTEKVQVIEAQRHLRVQADDERRLELVVQEIIQHRLGDHL